jgi:hypothetical protein
MNTDKIYAESIAKEYAPKDNSKIIALRKLDAKAKLPATVFTYTCGIISTLVFGTGMCLAMGVIGNMMGVGIAVGCAGILMVSSTVNLHDKMLKRRKKKYSEKIFEMSDSILNNK